MADDLIKEGQEVVFYFDNGRSYDVQGKVLHIPNGEDDCWVIEDRWGSRYFIRNFTYFKFTP